MSKHAVDWNNSWSFEEYIVHLFETKQTQSSEFQTLLKVFGREKLTKLWQNYKDKKKEELIPKDSTS